MATSESHHSLQEVEVPAVTTMMGLVTDGRINRCQGAVVLGAMCWGAYVAPYFVSEGRLWAAVAGAVVGMVAATFLSGLVLMFFRSPASPLRTISIPGARQRYRRMKRLLPFAIVVFIVFGVAPMFLLDAAIRNGWQIEFEILMFWPIIAVISATWVSVLRETIRAIETALRDEDSHPQLRQ